MPEAHCPMYVGRSEPQRATLRQAEPDFTQRLRETNLVSVSHSAKTRELHKHLLWACRSLCTFSRSGNSCKSHLLACAETANHVSYCIVAYGKGECVAAHQLDLAVAACVQQQVNSTCTANSTYCTQQAHSQQHSQLHIPYAAMAQPTA